MACVNCKSSADEPIKYVEFEAQVCDVDFHDRVYTISAVSI